MVEDQYLTFFHSCTKMRSVQSEGKEMPHYFMGACTFSKNPPFEMTSISKKPIIGKKFFSGNIYPPYFGSWRGIFPGGYVINKDNIRIVYGRQNHEMWMVKLDRQGLLDSLIPLTN
jgi:predicted GH43/DUF377 family glycosyl hydrolase